MARKVTKLGRSVGTQLFSRNNAGGVGPDGTQYYVELTVQSSQVSSDLTNFPVYVDLSTMPADFFANVQSNGGDIRVTESDGITRCPVELVSIDTSGSTGELHFLASSISSSVNTTFRIYYNAGGGISQPGVADTYGRNAVWADYGFVLHFDSDATDSTGNITFSEDTISYATGKVGNAASYDRSSKSRVYADNVTGPNGSDVTLSAWINPDSWNTNVDGTDRATVVEVGAYNDSTNFYGIRDIQTPFTTRWRQGGNNTDATASTPSTGSWTLLHARFNTTGNSTEYIKDGSSVSENTSSVSAISASAWQIGIGVIGQASISSLNLDYYWFDGDMDEVRLRNAISSDAWITAEYTNQNTPTTFYAVGNQVQI